MLVPLGIMSCLVIPSLYLGPPSDRADKKQKKNRPLFFFVLAGCAAKSAKNLWVERTKKKKDHGNEVCERSTDRGKGGGRAFPVGVVSSMKRLKLNASCLKIPKKK